MIKNNNEDVKHVAENSWLMIIGISNILIGFAA